MSKFTPRLTKPEKGNPYYNTRSNGGYSYAIVGSPTDPDCNVLSNCVGYAYGRFNEIGGYGKCKYLSPTNAENFIQYKGSCEVGQTPKLGACMVWQKGATLSGSDGAGHVAIVEQIISPTQIVTSESGWNSKTPFWTKTRNKGNGDWGAGSAYKFLGFIYNPAVSDEVAPTVVSGTPSTGSAADEKTLWNFLKGKGLNDYAVAGVMGNLYAECALRSNNLQQTYERKLGYTDEAYTAAVDNGSYDNFVKDAAGYGLAQWTYWSRKQKLLDYAKAAGKSIGDFQMQLDFLWKEVQGYTAVMNVLKSATSVREASDIFMCKFENPADQSDTAKARRASYGQKYYDKYASGSAETEKPAEPVEPVETERKIKKGDVVSILPGAVYYGISKAVPEWVRKKQWIVANEPTGSRVVIDKSTDGKNSIRSPIDAKYLTVVETSEPAEPVKPVEPVKPAEPVAIKVGDVVEFTGNTHYVSAYASKGPACKPGKAKVTAIYQLGKAKHPYHLVRVAGGSSTVWGWVDAADIAGASTETVEKPVETPVATIKKGSTVRVNKGAKTYDGRSLASFVYTRNHKVKEVSGDRAVITFSGITVAAVKVSDLTLIS